MVRKKKFEGQLATPMEPRSFEPGMLCPDDERLSQTLRMLDAALLEDQSKLELLCEHYGIEGEVNRYLRLSFALARDFVPGFQEKAQSGRPTKWSDIPIAALIIAMEHEIKPGRSASLAAKTLAKKARWKSFLGRGDEKETSPEAAEALRKQYQDHKNSNIAKVARAAFDPNASSGEKSESYENFRDLVNQFRAN